MKERAGHAASHSLKEKQHFKSMGNVFRADENSIKSLQRTIRKQKTNNTAPEYGMPAILSGHRRESPVFTCFIKKQTNKKMLLN